MYTQFFGLQEHPFSISPDPRYLFMSQRHREALAHLLYGIEHCGGFIQLTGEVGTGKTTLTRALLQQLPENVDIALLLNPNLTSIEFLQAICDELEIPYDKRKRSSIKEPIDALNRHLLNAHANGRRTVLLIDEAQNLDIEVLEQIRLLTNLETEKQKLLQIILVGQPELRLLIARKNLRQLSQRITARYHLLPLSESETSEFIEHRLAVAQRTQLLFTKSGMKQVYRWSKGIPRLINILCDRALLGAYSQNKLKVDAAIVRSAASEVIDDQLKVNLIKRPIWGTATAVGVLLLGIVWAIAPSSLSLTKEAKTLNLSNSLVSDIKLAEDVHNVALGASIDSMNLTEATHSKTLGYTIANVKELPVIDSSNIKSQAAMFQPTLNGLLQDPLVHNNTNTAFAKLFSLWGKNYFQVAGNTACARADKLALRCFYGKGTWNNLRNLNRPAVVELLDFNGGRHHVLITALSQDKVKLVISDTSQTFLISEVDPFWYGEFILLWKPPPFNIDIIRPGLQGNAALWVKNSLDKITGKKFFTPIENFYDENLRIRVIAFQKERYLTEDGIVGAKTIIHLNTALNDASIPLLENI